MALAMPTAIERDLTCGGCDYNLRGLPRDGACPECGRAVAATLSGAPSAAWLRRVSCGAALIGGGILLGGAGIAATIEWHRPWVLYAFPLGAVIAAVGTWAFATPRRARERALGIAVRTAGVTTAAMQLLATLIFAAAFGYFTT